MIFCQIVPNLVNKTLSGLKIACKTCIVRDTTTLYHYKHALYWWELLKAISYILGIFLVIPLYMLWRCIWSISRNLSCISLLYQVATFLFTIIIYCIIYCILWNTCINSMWVFMWFSGSRDSIMGHVMSQTTTVSRDLSTYIHCTCYLKYILSMCIEASHVISRLQSRDFPVKSKERGATCRGVTTSRDTKLWSPSCMSIMFAA